MAGFQVGNAPPIFFGLAKENGPCTVQKKNAFCPNLPVQASLGMRTLESHDRIKPARSHPSALHLGTHPAFKPQVVTWFLIPGCLLKRLTSGPAAAPWGWIPKEGAAVPSFWSFRKGVQGETQPKGFPPGLSLGATRFSRREKWVASAQRPSALTTFLFTHNCDTLSTSSLGRYL